MAVGIALVVWHRIKRGRMLVKSETPRLRLFPVVGQRRRAKEGGPLDIVQARGLKVVTDDTAL